MFQTLERFITQHHYAAELQGNELEAVYIGLEEDRALRIEMERFPDKIHFNPRPGEPDYTLCGCRVYVLRNARSHLGAGIKLNTHVRIPKP